MPRLPTLRPQEVVRVLERMGFVLIRQKGSHAIYIKDKIGLVVPMHNKDLKMGTLRHIIKQTGATLEEFIGFL